MQRVKDLPESAGWGKGRKFKVTAKFQDFKGNRRPYFSITGEIYHPRANDIDVGGCLHDAILKHFPDLAPLIRWHLAADDGLPTHYEANALYWLEFVHGISQWDFDPYGQFQRENRTALDVFKSHVVWGVLEQDTDEALSAYLEPVGDPDEGATIRRRQLLKEHATPLLQARGAALDKAMRKDMERFGIPYVRQETVDA